MRLLAEEQCKIETKNSERKHTRYDGVFTANVQRLVKLMKAFFTFYFLRPLVFQWPHQK